MDVNESYYMTTSSAPRVREELYALGREKAGNTLYGEG